MIRFIRKLLGLCEHRWEVVAGLDYDIWHDKYRSLEHCTKCQKYRERFIK